jgi:hypothetical protein
MIRILTLSAVIGLIGCAEVQNAADQTGRKAAVSAVTEVIAINFQQVPKPLIESFTTCVVNNAQAVEVRELAKASVVGVDADTVSVVRNVISRPATQSCLRDRAPLTI